MRSASTTQPEIRDRILGEAEHLFRSIGYSKTTVADIAKACGMSPANVYRFFESKVAINEAITQVILARMEAIGESILNEAASASVRLRKLILEGHRFSREQYLQESRVHEIVIKAMDEQWSVVDAHIERIRVCYRKVIEQGAKSGEFSSKDLELRAQCVFNAVLPFCHPQIVAERFATDNGVQAEAMADFLVRALQA